MPIAAGNRSIDDGQRSARRFYALRHCYTDSAAFKRLPEAVDAGFLHASGTYTGESVRRVRADGVLQDTDDSSADFEVIATPEPGG